MTKIKNNSSLTGITEIDVHIFSFLPFLELIKCRIVDTNTRRIIKEKLLTTEDFQTIKNLFVEMKKWEKLALEAPDEHEQYFWKTLADIQKTNFTRFLVMPFREIISPFFKKNDPLRVGVIFESMKKTNKYCQNMKKQEKTDMTSMDITTFPNEIQELHFEIKSKYNNLIQNSNNFKYCILHNNEDNLKLLKITKSLEALKKLDGKRNDISTILKICFLFDNNSKKILGLSLLSFILSFILENINLMSLYMENKNPTVENIFSKNDILFLFSIIMIYLYFAVKLYMNYSLSSRIDHATAEQNSNSFFNSKTNKNDSSQSIIAMPQQIPLSEQGVKEEKITININEDISRDDIYLLEKNSPQGLSKKTASLEIEDFGEIQEKSSQLKGELQSATMTKPKNSHTFLYLGSQSTKNKSQKEIEITEETSLIPDESKTKSCYHTAP